MIKKFVINDRKVMTIVWDNYSRIDAEIKDISLFRLDLPIRSLKEVLKEIQSDDSNYEWIYVNN